MGDNAALARIVPLSRTRLSVEIVDRLIRPILDREIEPGEKLPPERDLAQAFQVNRATVREALNRLEAMELVEIRHGDGVYVRDFFEAGSLELARHLLVRDGIPDLAVLQNLADLRRILVPEMARLAAQNRSEQDLCELHRLVFHSEDMPIVERDWRVHNIVARAGGNVLFVILLNSFTSMLRRHAHLYFDNAENVARSNAFHRDLFEAVRDRQPERARQLAFDVYEYSERSMFRVIEEIQRSTPVTR